MTNAVATNRLLRRYGGDYVKDIPVDIAKDTTNFKR